MNVAERADFLFNQQVFPFHILNAQNLLQAAESMVIRRLEAGRTLTLQASGNCRIAYGLGGRLRIQDGDGPVLYSTGISRHPIANTRSGNPVSITAEQPSELGLIDGSQIEDLLFWDQTARFALEQCDECGQRLEQVKQCPTFHRISPELLPEVVACMQPQTVAAGDEVVRQGEPGEAFYLLTEGRAEVWEQDAYDPGLTKVNELGPGDGFGEQAIIMGASRSATVRMASDGKLLVLNGKDYRDLVAASSLVEIDPEQVAGMLDQGYRLLDVRYEEENEESRIPDSQLIPLQRLRQRRDELQPDTPYVVYCRSGKRSAVAATLMGQFGIQAVSLRGGILGWSYETESDW